MKGNNITALDYRAQGDTLEITFTDTSLDAIAGMDTALVSIQTDDGDPVEGFVGYAVKTITYVPENDTYVAHFVRGVKDTTADVLNTLAAQITAQGAAQEDIMLAVAELGGIVAAGSGEEV